jgi:hypothetical protein
MVDMEQSQHHKKLSSIEMEVEMRCDWKSCERRVRMTSIAQKSHRVEAHFVVRYATSAPRAAQRITLRN